MTPEPHNHKSMQLQKDLIHLSIEATWQDIKERYSVFDFMANEHEFLTTFKAEYLGLITTLLYEIEDYIRAEYPIMKQEAIHKGLV